MRFLSGPLALLELSTNSVLFSLCWSQSTMLPSYNSLCHSEQCCLSGCFAPFQQQSVQLQIVLFIKSLCVRGHLYFHPWMAWQHSGATLACLLVVLKHTSLAPIPLTLTLRDVKLVYSVKDPSRSLILISEDSPGVLCPSHPYTLLLSNNSLCYSEQYYTLVSWVALTMTKKYDMDWDRTLD